MRRLLITTTTLLAVLWCRAQIPNNTAFPSANNTFLGASSAGASTINVDQYTGSAMINVPICNLGSRELQVPVSLSYRGGRGIKLQDYASCVGLGWQLDGGGSISRVVRGFPDEFPNGYLGTGLWGQKIVNYFQNGVPMSQSDWLAVSGDDGVTLQAPTADGEPDLFYVKTPFFSFQFVFDESGNIVTSNSSGYKILTAGFYNTSNYQYPNFVLIDNAGNQYTFGASTSTVEKVATTIYGTSYTFPTTWYLTSILTFNSKDYITFNYVTSSYNETNKHYQKTKTYNTGCSTTNADPLITTIIQPKYLSSIVGINGEIDFSYLFDRRDVINAGRLTTIVLKSYSSAGTTTLKTFALNHSYFGDPTTDSNMLRLRLDNVTIAGNTSATSNPVNFREFTYNTTDNLPSRTSDVFDYWGYYTLFTPINGSTDPMDYPELRVPNENRTKANILTAVKELSGASCEIAYELNKYNKDASNPNFPVGGLRVTSLSRKLSTGENIQTTYSYVDDAGKSTGQILTPAYVNMSANTGGVNKVFSETISNVYDLNGNFIGYSSVKAINQNGGYIISEFRNFSDDPDIFNYQYYTSPYLLPNITTSVSLAYKRGLLKSQVVKNAANKKITQDDYSYGSLTSPASTKSWAYRAYLFAPYICNNGGILDFGSKYWTNVENYVLTSKTHKDFDQLNDNNYVQTVINYTYCPNKRSIQTATATDSKGLTTTQTFYHADDPSIPMLTTPEQTAVTSLLAANNSVALVHQTSVRNGVTTQLHNTFSTNVGGTNSRIYLTASSSYKGSTLVNQQFYNYDNIYSNLLSSNIPGGKSSSILYGYNSTVPVASIINANSSYVLQPGTGSGTINGLSASFTSDYNGTIGINIQYTSGSGTCTVNYSLTGPASRSGTLCLTVGGNCSGNPSGATFTNMPPGTYTLNFTPVSNTFPSLPPFFYSYPKNQPVLTNEFYYEGFEESSNVVTGSAHTGRGYYNAIGTPYSVNFNLPNARSYIIQWWNWVTGKWVLNEQAYTGPRTISGIIDDIRIFPSDALMQTFTYNPLVGKTGEVDAAGRSSAFEYDGLGRLNIVKDDDRNIVSRTCYSYSGQTINCTAGTVWTNSPQSGVYARNDCAPGYVGTPITYPVPAGRYSSTISPEDANQLAINDVLTNGQAYANNPTNGSVCIQTITVTYNNQTTVNWGFTATNNSTGTVYNSTLNANTNGSLSITLPAGTYTFVFTSGGQATSNPAQFTVNGVVQNYGCSNITATFNNVSVSTSSTNPLITVVTQTPAACSFTPASAWGIPSSGISASGCTVTFYIVLYTNTSQNWANALTAATINGGCKPSVTRTFQKTDASGRNWEIVVYATTGQMTVRLLTGTPPGTGTTFYLSGCSYSL